MPDFKYLSVRQPENLGAKLYEKLGYLIFKILGIVKHMEEEDKKLLRKKGVAVKSEAANRLLPNTVNHIILVGATLVVVLATLADPNSHNLCLYRTLLCTLLITIVFGVLCTAILTIDVYILGRKVLKVAEEAGSNHAKPKYIRTGIIPLVLISFSFLLCLFFFLISVVLLVIYAW